jgi:hypothetical protein
MDTKTETELAARMVSDVVAALDSALSGWQEMAARAEAEGLDVATEAAAVAQAIGKVQGLIVKVKTEFL